MNDILIWIEHHPAIGAVITSIIVGLIAAIGWLVNLFINSKPKTHNLNMTSGVGAGNVTAGRDIIVSTNKKENNKSGEVISALATELKTLEYVLGDFNEFTVGGNNYINFRSNVEIFMDKLTRLAALFSVHELSIYSKFDELRNMLKEILAVRLALDGGTSFRRLKDLVLNAKNITSEMVSSLKELI